jgi:hypothetical protein
LGSIITGSLEYGIGTGWRSIAGGSVASLKPAFPQAQPASQLPLLPQPPLQEAPQPPLQDPQPFFSASHVYSHSGHLYFFVFSFLILRIVAPLLGQALQDLHPLPSQEVQEPHDFLLHSVLLGRCQGNTTRGMQM